MKRLALSLLSLLVLLVLFEVALQVREIGKRKEILAGRSDADLGTIRADPPLLYTLKPGWHDMFNSHGFRDVERSKAKAENVFRLAVVGDSVTMQMDVPLEKLRRFSPLFDKSIYEAIRLDKVVNSRQVVGVGLALADRLLLDPSLLVVRKTLEI